LTPVLTAMANFGKVKEIFSPWGLQKILS
jgi:hypothetical protein